MSNPSLSIVLVPGAWHGPWAWAAVADRLRAADHRVAVVGLRSAGPDTGALGGLYDDAAVVREAVAALPGEVIVVGHSYGGMPVTEAATPDRVRHLVYLAAFLGEPGRNQVSIIGPDAPPVLAPTPDGRALLPKDPIALLYNGCSDELARDAAARLVPQSIASLTEPLTRAAWREIPSTYVITDRDQGVAPELQARMSAGCSVRHHLDTGHSALLSHPNLVAGMIADAVADLPVLAA